MIRKFYFTWIASLKSDCKVALCFVYLTLASFPLVAQGAVELFANIDSGICGRPAMAADGTNFLAVWADNNDIYGARVTHAGVVLDTTSISISTAVGDAFCPSVAYDGTNFLVVWPGSATATNPDLEMYTARISPAGNVLNTDIQVTTTTSPLTGRPYSLAFDGTNYLVVWRTETQTVVGTRVTTTGTSLDGDGFIVSALANSKYPWVAFGGGSFLVAFHATATNGYGMYGVHVATDGSLVAPGIFLISDEVGDEAHASVVYGGGNFLVAWLNGGSNYLDISTTNTVHAVRVDTGIVLDTPALLVANRARSQQPVVTAFNGIDYFVVWQSEWSEAIAPGFVQNQYRHTDIYARRVSTSGTLVDAGPFPAETNEGHQFGPRVAFDGGSLLIAWNESLSDARTSGGFGTASILIRVLDAQATGIGTAPVVQAPVSGGWTPQTNPSSSHLYDVYGADDNNVYAFSEATGVGTDAEVLHYNGILWSLSQTLPVSRIFAGFASPTNEVVFSGWCGSLHYSEFINGWVDVFGGGGACAHAGGIWAGGSSADNLYVVTSQGRAFHFDGTTRTEIPTGISTDLLDISGTHETDLYAVGSYGRVFNFDGLTWNQMTGVPTSHSLNSVWVSRSGEIFAVGDFGRIVYYDGNSWTLQDSGTDQHLFGVSGNSVSEVYAVGLNGTVVHYDGNNWQAEISGTMNDLFGIWVGANSAWAVGEQGTILTRPVTVAPAIPTPVVGPANTAISDTSFDSGEGEKVVFGFKLTSDSTDAEIRELTVSTNGDIGLDVVRLYQDVNKNGIPEINERLGPHKSYSAGNGEITFTLPQAYQLPIGDTHFLVTYGF